MKKRSNQKNRAGIGTERIEDRKKLNFLARLAFTGVAIRLLLYALPFNLSGLLVELLWLPLLLLLLALPFYGFEKLLDKVKND